jgi:CRISPR system Cascade subunit CasD
MGMPTLLLRIQGPMQSWGTDSRFDLRRTGLEPSKSGIVGMLCAALGRDRREHVDDLAALRMGVRVDREGVLSCDYQTAERIMRASAEDSKGAVQSWRYYLADAAFLVGLESDRRDILDTLSRAVRAPHWQVFLGRKGYVPSPPVWLGDGVVETPLEESLAQHPPLVQPPPTRYRYVLEERVAGTSAALWNRVRRTDQPAAPFAERRYTDRYVLVLNVAPGDIPRVPL